MPDTFQLILQGIGIVMIPQNLLLLAAGVVIGLIAGSIPGLSSTNTTAMLLPVTLAFPMESALIFIVSVYMASQYGGSISAILIKTPGTSGGIATTFDGFPLNQQGKAGYALGLSLGASTFGGIVASFIVIFIMKPISGFALNFQTAELFLLSLLGISIIISIAGKRPIKGALAGVIGLLVAAMPAEPTYGKARLTFGFFQLYDGVPLIPLLCGFFAFASMIDLVGEKFIAQVGDEETVVGMRSILQGAKKAMTYPVNLIRSTLLGLFIGILPGAGVDAAALLSYSQAQTWSKHPETFGTGEPEGIVAPEASNNAVTAGALVPAMSLGIPGSATAAVMLAAMTLHGVTPGPKVMEKFPTQIYSVFVAILLSTILMFVFGLLYTAVVSRLASVNLAYLIPGVLTICIMGSLANRGFMFDVYIFLIFGLLGYLMSKNGFGLAPMVLGVVMGTLAEQNFSIAIKLSSGDFGIFFQSPTAWVIWAVLIVTVAYPPLRNWRNRKKAKEA